MKLKHLTDEALLADTRALAAQERSLTAKLLHYLREIDGRRLYAELGYASMYLYAVRELGYSEGSAYRRIQAARLLGQVPEIAAKIEDGSLNLVHIAETTKFFQHNDIRDPGKKKAVLEAVQGMNRKDCETRLRELAAVPKPRIVTIPVLEETFVKLERFKRITSRFPSTDEAISIAVDLATPKLEKERFKTVRRDVSTLVSKPCVKHVSAMVKRAVYERDRGVCQSCGGTSQLQFDHRKPLALGGVSDVENLRLLCFSCNQRARIRAGL
jgi:hypothetical protein